MSSGNSGSIQSSSGGDEEYDSRSESLSSFLNSSGHLGHMFNPQPPTSSLHHNHPSFFFDPLSNYMEPFSQSASNPNANSLLNSDLLWSRGLRSEPNCTDIGGLINSLSSSIQPITSAQGPGRSPYPSSSSMPLPLLPENGVGSLATSDQTKLVRNSKKRSRASRRAPTTVLTTDTSNFRAMVQEFTGIPAPPFSASPFSRSRLDLFSTMRPSHLEPTPPTYHLRPLPQKVPPSFASTTNIGSSSNTTAAATATANASNSTSPSNYQVPSDLGLPKQSQNLLNLQNPVLTFQSHLQSPSFLPPINYQLANVAAMGAKSQGPSMIPSNNSQLKLGLLEEFGMSHGNLSGVSSLAPSDRMSLRSSNNPSSWGDMDGDQGHLKVFNGNYGISQRVGSCKMNYSASSSEFHADKGSENVSSRGEGMVDSWICSSD